MIKRILSLILLMTTGLALCACPGGAPVEPPVGNCPNCGKNPCECPTGKPCPDCGNDPCTCKPADPSQPIGKDVTVTPDKADFSIVFGDGAAVTGAGDSLAGNAPCLSLKPYSEDGAVAKPAARFFAQIDFNGKTYKASGTGIAPLKSASDKTYGDSKTTVLILPNGAEFSENNNLTFENLIIVGDLTISSGDGYLFKNVQFVGRVTVGKNAKNVAFDGCRFSSLENAGTDTFLINSYVGFAGTGVLNSGAGLYVQNCRFEGTGTAISSTGDALEVRNSSISTSEDGIGVEIKDSKNSLVALSVIRGTQKSVVMNGTHNTAVVKNSVISLHAVAGTNTYLIDNAMGGRVFSENNNYFIADGNTYPDDGRDHRAVASGNQNVNGTTLTDEEARLDVGANEALLPHINKDQFLEMDRRATVKEYGASKALPIYDYLMEKAKTDDVVIVAPGAYAVDETASFTADHSNTTVYAYGVLAEAVEYSNQSYTKGHFRFNYVNDFALKGIFTSYAQPTCGQVYVLKKLGDNQVLAVTGAGFWNEFANSNKNYVSGSSVSFQRAGTNYVYGEWGVSNVEKKSDGTMILTLPDTCYEVVKVGDIGTCRIAGGTVFSASYCRDLVYKDVTQYGNSGSFAFAEGSNYTATTYYRVADTTKAAMIIDEATYDRYTALQGQYGVDLEISIDELEGGKLRYRGSPAWISSVDGVHNSSSVEGSKVICCLFENMCDDGTNQKSMHARLSEVKDNGDGTVTIIYKGNLSNHVYSSKKQDSTFTLFCSRFEKGDRVYIYTSGGQLVCDTPALGDAVAASPIMSNCPGVTSKEIQRFAVTVKAEDVNMKALEGYDLNDDSYLPDHKVVVDNMSKGSYGFVYDNNLVQNLRSNGMRVKASGGLITNCTFRNISKCAILMAFEIWWGESSVAENTTIRNNLIDHTSYGNDHPALDNPSDSYRSTPISIMGLGGKTMDADHLLYKDILIEGNKFINRCVDNYNYAIFARSTVGMVIRNNDFGTAPDEDGLDKYATAIYLNSVVDLELSGNTYSPYIPSKRDYVGGDRYKNVHGTDVEENGVSIIPDKDGK